MATRLPQRAKKSKKHRKHGRNLAFCTAYKNSGRREKNKCERLAKHLIKHPGDNVAKHCLANGGRRSAAP